MCFFSPTFIEINPRKKFREEMNNETSAGINTSGEIISTMKRRQNNKKKIREIIKLVLRNLSALIIYLILILSL